MALKGKSHILLPKNQLKEIVKNFVYFFSP